MVLLVLKLFVSSHHLNFEGVLAFMFCYSTKDKLDTTLLCFSLWLKQMYHFQCIIAHCHLFVLLFMCNIVAKFTLVQIIFIMPLLKCFDLSLQCFYISLIKIVLASCHLKNYFVITYLLEDEQELSLGMLIRCKRIYNFWCSMLVFYPMPLCFPHVFTCFPSFSGCFHALTY